MYNIGKIKCELLKLCFILTKLPSLHFGSTPIQVQQFPQAYIIHNGLVAI